jgi:hypothetical protein
VATSACPEIITTAGGSGAARTRSSSASPSMSGIFTSESTTSQRLPAACSRSSRAKACLPFGAVQTS